VILPVAALLIAVILALLLRSLVAPVILVLAVLLNFAVPGASLTALLGHATWWPGHGDVAKVATGPAPVPGLAPVESR
jgi:RND superfamily putative drug exporter